MMLREAAPWHWAMASVVVALAVATAALRRREQAGIALGLGTISMGLLVSFAANELLAIYWTVMGLGILVGQLAVAARSPGARLRSAPRGSGRRAWALIAVIAVWLGLLALVVVRYLPGETYLIDSEAMSARDLAHEMVFLAHGEFAPALLGVGLTLLAAVAGGHLYRGES